MSYGRLAVAAVVATVVDMVYGFLVYGMLLTKQFASYPTIFRAPDAQVAYTGWMAAGVLLGMIAAAFVYAKGYEGGPGLAEGARFGCLMGVFIIGYVYLVDYSIMNLGRRIILAMSVAAWIEWVIVGASIGLTYRPRIAVRVKPATV